MADEQQVEAKANQWWDECVGKGEELWDRMKEIETGDDVVLAGTPDKVDEWYEPKPVGTGNWTGNDEGLRLIAEDYGEMDLFRQINVVSREGNLKKGDENLGPGTPYINYFNVQEGIIVFGENFLA
jgi:hypothetical protein